MIEEKLKEYVNMLDNSKSIKFLNVKKELLVLSVDDKELGALLATIEGKNNEECKNIVNAYLNNKKLEKVKEEKEVVSKVFGIDVSEVEHRQLNNGKEVFAFYDSNYSRKRILENPTEGESLTQQLKRIQNENMNFQNSNDYKVNTNDILKKQTMDFDCEIKMIYINDIDNYQKIINGLNERERVAFEYLLTQKDINNIKYVNIENNFALDKDGNMIESFIDENTNKPIIEKPKEYNYQIKEIDNEDETYGNTSIATYNTETETFEISYDDLEDIPDLIEAELLTYNVDVNEGQIKEIGNNIIKYYKNPDKMTGLPERERTFYEEFVSILAEKLDLKKKQNQANQMKLEYDNNSGFSTILLVTILTLIIGVIIILMIK